MVLRVQDPYESVRERAARYYAGKLAAHGPTPAGVDWNSETSQQLRFTQLLRICGDDRSASINDFGCGYGALLSRLRAEGHAGAYHGYDPSAEMVRAAQARHATTSDCVFSADERDLPVADFTVASGVFNVRQDVPVADWEEYIRAGVRRMIGISRRGVAFNLLTAYSDADRLRADLYYAPPAAWLDYCLRHLSRRSALLHDYPLYEFTLLVRLGEG